MTAPLPLMTESEVRTFTGEAGEHGFGCCRTERGQLPLAEMSIDARVIATFAHTTLRQVFVNTFGVPLEVTYIFPLPDRAAVTRFTMEVNGRRIDGVLEERMQARRSYDAAIAQGKRASIAEEERAGVFSIRVGNLMPGERATITLELAGALPVADGEVTYRFPLVVAPRYMPGQLLGGTDVGDGVAHDTDAVPDASRISPPVLLAGMSAPVRLGISVELDAAGLPLSQVRSSLHAAYADQRAGRLVVSLPPGERLDRDFILRFHLGDEAVRTSARTLADAVHGGAGTTFALTLLPPTVNVVDKPKDVVFVLDRSGSMQGWKMVAARRAVARMIDALRAHDRFSVLAFDNVVDELRPDANATGLVNASDRNRFRATELLAKVESRGGTEMAEPLARAADLLAGGYLERDRVLVFVTDGQVGNEAQLLKLLGQRLKGARVFPLGIDQAVNAGFLNKLAALGRAGTAELIESEDRLDEVLVRLHRRVDAPVIAELSLEIEGARLAAGSLAPAQLPDVFAGVPATVFGRLEGGSRATFVVRGRYADGRPFEERITAMDVQNPAVRSAWARMHLRDLEDRFDAGQGDRGGLERNIVEVSLQHGVLCRFTAFVAVDHEVVNRGGWQKQLTQAVEQPAGWADSASGAPPAPTGGRRATGTPMAAPAPAPMPKQARAASQARAELLDDEAAMLDGAAAPQWEEKTAASPPPPPRAASAARMREAASDLSRAAAEPAGPAEPAPARGVKSKSEGGFFGAVKDALGLGRTGSAPPATLAARLPERLLELVELCRKRAADLLGTARELEQRLRLLLEDLAHAGATTSERHPLEEALRTVQEALRGGDTVALEAAMAAVEQALVRASGAVPQPATGGHREGFWR